MLRRLSVIRRSLTKPSNYEYKYSFTNANLAQYTEKGIAYMQAQRFFVAHCIKENKQIPGMDEYQTRNPFTFYSAGDFFQLFFVS